MMKNMAVSALNPPLRRTCFFREANVSWKSSSAAKETDGDSMFFLGDNVSRLSGDKDVEGRDILSREMS